MRKFLTMEKMRLKYAMICVEGYLKRLTGPARLVADIDLSYQ